MMRHALPCGNCWQNSGRVADDSRKQTFTVSPDYWTTNTSFASPRKVTDANPFITEYAWGSRVLVDLLYGDHEGGQRAIARFTMTPEDEASGRTANVVRYWNIDREDPR